MEPAACACAPQCCDRWTTAGSFRWILCSTSLCVRSSCSIWVVSMGTDWSTRLKIPSINSVSSIAPEPSESRHSHTSMSWSDSRMFLRSAGRCFMVVASMLSNPDLNSLRLRWPFPRLSSSWKRAFMIGSRALNLLRFMASSNSRSESPWTMAASTMRAVIKFHAMIVTMSQTRPKKNTKCHALSTIGLYTAAIESVFAN
mmetsp:Transcript_80519/g.216357  ORF Transcript_80519/g.216357 Transcript_80519/m.216357 type:complete len:200 (+) Transcript_80519:135-734(+)